ncbi:MAG: hypothetical protein KAI62_02780, partial [Actinomycetia bacterium]|nr:hypothetical protein [Actinomycetes bacterium]
AAEQAVLDAIAALAAVNLVVLDAPGAVEAAEQAVLDAKEAAALAIQAVADAEKVLEDLESETPAPTQEKIDAAEQAVKDAEEAAALAVQAVADAEAVLAAVKLLIAAELEAAELEAALEAAEKAVEDAIAALEEPQDAVEDAIAALEEGEPGENGIKYSHIIINSNNGGSFKEEGNYSGADGEGLNFTFESKEGFDLVWLRIGNIKIEVTEDMLPYLESFNKKNLTIHAHFKKDKGYSPDPEITVEETDLEEIIEQEDENDDEKDNGKGKDKEKSNNGKKKDK